jgi:hypothetical protein
MLHSQARVIADTICQVTLATSLFLMDDWRQEITRNSPQFKRYGNTTEGRSTSLS